MDATEQAEFLVSLRALPATMVLAMRTAMSALAPVLAVGLAAMENCLTRASPRGSAAVWLSWVGDEARMASALSFLLVCVLAACGVRSQAHSFAVALRVTEVPEYFVSGGALRFSALVALGHAIMGCPAWVPLLATSPSGPGLIKRLYMKAIGGVFPLSASAATALESAGRADRAKILRGVIASDWSWYGSEFGAGFCAGVGLWCSLLPAALQTNQGALSFVVFSAPKDAAGRDLASVSFSGVSASRPLLLPAPSAMEKASDGKDGKQPVLSVSGFEDVDAWCVSVGLVAEADAPWFLFAFLLFALVPAREAIRADAYGLLMAGRVKDALFALGIPGILPPLLPALALTPNQARSARTLLSGDPQANEVEALLMAVRPRPEDAMLPVGRFVSAKNQSRTWVAGLLATLAR